MTTSFCLQQPTVLRRSSPPYSILVTPRLNPCIHIPRSPCYLISSIARGAAGCAPASFSPNSDLSGPSVETPLDQQPLEHQQEHQLPPHTAGPPSKTSKSQEPSPEQQQFEDVRFMRLALDQGLLAAAAGEVPVGAVLVHDGAVIASAHNLTHSTHSPLAHAEMLCIGRAAEHMQAWRLLQATLYVTIEPCPMCAGAILQSRLKRVVYGAPQPRMGCDGSWLSMFPSQEEPQTKSSTQTSTDAKVDSDVGGSETGMGSIAGAEEELAGDVLIETAPSAGTGVWGQAQGVSAHQGVGQSKGVQGMGAVIQVQGDRTFTEGTTITGRVDKKQRNLLSAAAALRGSVDPDLKRIHVSQKAKRGLSGQVAQRGVSPWSVILKDVGQQKRPIGTGEGEQRLHPFHPDLKVCRGVLREEAAALMKSFFKQRRADRLDTEATD